MADHTENYTSKFKVDISDLKKGIAEANKAIKTANAEFKNATAGTDNWSKSADGLSAKIKQQESIVEAEKKKLELLKEQLSRLNQNQEDGKKIVSELTKKYQDAVKTYGETSDEAKQYLKQLTDAESAQERNAKAVEALNLKIINQDTAVKNAESQVGKYQSALSDLQNHTETLTDKVQRQQSELTELKQQYANVAAEQGKDSDEAKNLANQISSLSSELKENRNKLNDAEQAADTFDDSLEDVDESAEKTTNGGLNAFTVALGNLASQVITAVIGKLKDMAAAVKDAYNEFDTGKDNVIKATGATGEAAQELVNSYAQVAENVSGDFGTIGSTLGEVNTRFGFTGDKLEETTEQFMKFADITGMDAVSAVQKVSRAMGDAGINSSEYSSVLDELAIAAQASGISVDTLSGYLTSYGAPMRALGFDTKEAISIFSQWELAGVNTETAFSGMKTAIASWSDKGKDAKEEFRKTLDEIAAAPTIAEATTKAIEAFGKKAGPDLADAIQGGRFEYSNFLDLLETSEGTVENTYDATQNFADKWGLEIQKLRIKAADLADNLLNKYSPQISTAFEMVQKVLDKVFPAVEAGIDWVSEHIDSFLAEYSPQIREAMAAVEDILLNTVLPAIRTVIDWIKENVGSLIAEYSPQIHDALETIRNVLMNQVYPVIEMAIGWLIDHGNEVIGILSGIAAGFVAFKAVTMIQSAVSAVQGAISAFSTLAGVIQTVGLKQAALNLIMSANPVGLIVAAIAGLVTAFVVLWNKSDKFRNFWIGLWDSIQETLYGFFDAWISGWNSIKEFFSNVWNSFQEVFQIGMDAVVSFFLSAKDKSESAWSGITLFFVSLWEGIQTIFSTVAEWINTNVFEPIKSFFQPVITFFTEAWAIIGELSQGCIKLIFAVWTVASQWFDHHVIQPVKEFFSKLWEAVSGFVVNTWENIKTGWKIAGTWFKDTVITPISNFFVNLWKAVSGFASAAWENIKTGWKVVGTWFKDTVITPVKNFFVSMWDGVKSGAVQAWEGIRQAFAHIADWFEEKFSAAWQKVKNVFSTGGEIFAGITDGILSAFKTVVNALIRGINNIIAVPFNAINDMLDRISGVEIAGFMPFSGLVSRFSVPQIPQLAQGGIVKKPTIAEIGEAGAEAVIPLERNKAGLKMLAELLSNEIQLNLPAVPLPSPEPVINNYNYNVTQNNTSPKALSQYELYRQTKNLVRTLKRYQ